MRRLAGRSEQPLPRRASADGPKPGQLITRDRFLDDVWSGIPVTDEALSQCIANLRRTLGDDASKPRFIETVPKHGYRFIAPVEERQAVTQTLIGRQITFPLGWQGGLSLASAEHARWRTGRGRGRSPLRFGRFARPASTGSRGGFVPDRDALSQHIGGSARWVRDWSRHCGRAPHRRSEDCRNGPRRRARRARRRRRGAATRDRCVQRPARQGSSGNRRRSGRAGARRCHRHRLAPVAGARSVLAVDFRSRTDRRAGRRAPTAFGRQADGRQPRCPERGFPGLAAQHRQPRPLCSARTISGSYRRPASARSKASFSAPGSPSRSATPRACCAISRSARPPEARSRSRRSDRPDPRRRSRCGRDCR